MRAITMGGAIAAVILALMTTVALAAPRDGRIALVVGNGRYVNAEALRNPVNDARAMAKVLTASGFDVILRENVGRRAMTEALQEFASRVTPGGVGLFYFAGHGIQVRGANYLLPVDAALSSEFDLKYETLDVSDVLVRLDEARVRLSLVILDACRDNPFSRSFRSANRGLAPMDAPRGTVIAYATAPGDTAADGSGDNGLYTGELLKAIAIPGLKLEEVFKRTIDGVARGSASRQTPWISSSFRGDFYFTEASAPAPPPVAAPAPPPPSPSGVSPEALELAAWSAISSSSNPAMYEAFLQRFPNGIYGGLARARLAELKAAQTANDAEARRRDDAEAKRMAALDEARRKTDAAAEAKRLADEEARRKADAATEAKRLADEEARRKTDAAAEARRLADEEARRQASAPAKPDPDADAARAAAEAEQQLRMGETERRRVQVALTAKGFDTGGADGAFGPRTRQMIAGFQRTLNAPATGYLNAVQYAALLSGTDQAWAREEARRKAEDEARRKAAADKKAPAVGAGGFDGTWRGTVGVWAISLVVNGQKGRLTMVCGASESYTFAIAVSPEGTINALVAQVGMNPRNLGGQLPNLSISGGAGSCLGGAGRLAR